MILPFLSAELQPEPEEEEEPEELDTSGLELRVEVRPSSVHGFGVFATEKIGAGEKICYCDGELKDARVRVVVSDFVSALTTIAYAWAIFFQSFRSGHFCLRPSAKDQGITCVVDLVVVHFLVQFLI